MLDISSNCIEGAFHTTQLNTCPDFGNPTGPCHNVRGLFLNNAKLYLGRMYIE